MSGKLLVGAGCLWCALWARPAAAETTAKHSIVAESAREQPVSLGPADAHEAPESSEGKAAEATTGAEPDAALAGESNTVLLGFEAPGYAARLQSDADPDGIAKGWFTLCFAPCTRRVPADARFRAVGERADPSESFRLPEGRDRVLVTTMLKKHSSTAPAVLMVVGFSALVVGPILFVGGIAKGMSGQDPNGVMLLTGAGLTIGGAIAGTSGLIWYLTGSKSRQSIVTVARSTGPRLALPGGIGLESRGFTF